MITQEEWQQRIDHDFPYGARCKRETYAGDPDPWSFRTACLTIVSLVNEHPKLIFFAADVDGHDYRIVLLTYTEIQTEPVRVIRTTCPDQSSWTFADAIPEHVGEAWKERKRFERRLALELGKG